MNPFPIDNIHAVQTKMCTIMVGSKPLPGTGSHLHLQFPDYPSLKRGYMVYYRRPSNVSFPLTGVSLHLALHPR